MIRLKFPYVLLINFSLCILGAFIAYIGINQAVSVQRSLLEAIGIGLFAAGAVNLLDQSLGVELPPPPPPPPPQPSAKERVILASYRRKDTAREILELKYNATKVDILGVTLNHALEEIVKDRKQTIIKNLLFHNLQLRLFLVHPNSSYLSQRAVEDNEDISLLVARQKATVAKCAEFYKLLRKRYDIEKRNGTLDTRLTGTLQIKLLDFCPYISIYRINEDRIYWGLYTSGTTGVNLPLFLTTPERDPELYAHLHDHIHGLMRRDQSYPDLVRMPSMGEPVLNEELFRSICGSG